MPPLAIAVAGSVAAGAISGAIGNAASAGDREKALAQNQAAVQQWLNINVPNPDEQKLYLQKFVQTGQFDPKIEQALKQDTTAYQQVQTDPRLRESQMRSLDALQNIGSNGGMTLDDQANLQKITNDTNVQDKGRRDAIVDNMARRGISGSGLDLAAQLDSTQAATNREAQAGLDTAAAARSRALDAIMKGGQLGGQMEAQQYGEQSDLAKAKDAINNFNTRNLQDVNARNASTQNNAQLYNLNQAQNISNANTDLKNKEQAYNTSLVQQQFDNQAKKAAGAAGQYGQVANDYNQAAQRTANMYGGIGSAVSQGIGAYGAYANNPKTSSATAGNPYGTSYAGPDDEDTKWASYKA